MNLNNPRLAALVCGGLLALAIALSIGGRIGAEARPLLAPSAAPAARRRPLAGDAASELEAAIVTAIRRELATRVNL